MFADGWQVDVLTLHDGTPFRRYQHHMKTTVLYQSYNIIIIMAEMAVV